MLIRVFIISNFLLLLSSLKTIVESRSETFSVVGIAETHSQAIELMSSVSVDVVILDIDGNSEEILLLIETLSIVSLAKVIALTRLQDADFQDKAIVCGAKGILNHNTTPDLLLNAISRVHQGEMWFNRATAERMLNKFLNGKSSADNSVTKLTLLTEREHEIFTFIIHSKGEPAKAIASKLHISESTLRNHLTSIYEKLGVMNRHGLLAFAYQNGLTERPR